MMDVHDNQRDNQHDNTRHAAGRIVIGSLIFTSTNIAMASAVNDKTPRGTTRYAIEAAFSASGKRFAPRFEVDEGERLEVRSDHAGMLLVARFEVHKTSSATAVQIKTRINDGARTVAQSTLISTLGQSSGILIDTVQGPVELSLLIAELAR